MNLQRRQNLQKGDAIRRPIAQGQEAAQEPHNKLQLLTARCQMTN